MKIESHARARTLQALYAWDLRAKEPLDRVASRVFDDLAVGPEERKIASLLVRTIISHGAEIDAKLSEVTENWRLDRLGTIERCVLRLAGAELHRRETPPRVVIQEAVRLAERYGTREGARFVNGVLDAYARRAGVL